MRLIFLILVLASLFLSSSCLRRDASLGITDYFNDSSYSKVVLLQLDSTFYHCYDMDSLQDNAGMKAIDDGIGFIDSTGTILSDKIIRKQLSPHYVTRLKQLIHRQKENESYFAKHVHCCLQNCVVVS